LSASAAVEPVVKIGVTLASFTVGETFLPVCLVLVPVAALLAWRGRRGDLPSATPPAFLGIAALVGFVGAARWVTWPFVAARLLWLLPFFLLLVAAGCFTLRPRARKIALAAILISFVSSEVLYFRRETF
jgi:hypothetical protein